MNTVPKCVIHCRVSTGKQAQEGESLDVQKNICLDIAERNGWAVAHEPWVEAYSGRKSLRPAFEEVLAFLDEHPGQVRYYVFRAIDRFTRGGTGTYERMKEQLARRGVELVDSMGVIQPSRNTLEHVGFEYEWSRVSPSEIAEVVLASTAKAEATNILTRMIGQEIRLTQQGYKIRDAVDGFQNERIYVAGKKRVIQVPHPERARFYVAMFEMRAAGNLTDEQIADRINAMGYRSPLQNRWDASHHHIVGRRGGKKLDAKNLQRIVKRPIYCGIVVEKWTNWKPVRAAYDGLVSVATWNAANRNSVRIEETASGLELVYADPTKRRWTKINPEYPYKNVVLCPNCRGKFLGSASRGKSGRSYAAYHCTRTHPRVARNKAAFDTAVSGCIRKLSFNPDVIEVAAAALWKIYEDRVSALAADAGAVSRFVRGLEMQRDEAVRAFAAATTDTMRRALELEVERIERQIADSQTHSGQIELRASEFSDYLASVVETMEHPAELLQTPVNPSIQRKRFGMVFEPLPTLYEIENGTPQLSPIIRLCEGDKDADSVLVNLKELSWNSIEEAVRRWRNL